MNDSRHVRLTYALGHYARSRDPVEEDSAVARVS